MEEVPEDHDDIDVHLEGEHQGELPRSDAITVDLLADSSYGLSIEGCKADKEYEAKIADDQHAARNWEEEGGNGVDKGEGNKAKESKL